jgi:hypothetical protein
LSEAAEDTKLRGTGSAQGAAQRQELKMTAPQPKATASTARKPAAKKTPAQVTPIAEKVAAKEAAKAGHPSGQAKAANKEALEAAKKVQAALEPTPPPAPAKKAAAKKAPAKKATTSTRVAPLPRDQWKLPTPAKLEWTAKTVKEVDYEVAEGARHLYRVHHGSDGWYAQQKLKQGSWSSMAGVCKTVEEAKTLAGYNEGGALWLAYSSVVGVPFEKLVEEYS